jgi:hypothetical protein
VDPARGFRLAFPPSGTPADGSPRAQQFLSEVLGDFLWWPELTHVYAVHILNRILAVAGSTHVCVVHILNVHSQWPAVHMYT